MSKIYCNQFGKAKQAFIWQEARLIYKGEKLGDLQSESSDNTLQESSRNEIKEVPIEAANGIPIDADAPKALESTDKKEASVATPDKERTLTGAEFMHDLPPYGEAREQAIYEAAVANENIPESLKQFKAVDVSTVGPDGTVHTGKIFVMPDYLSVGTDGNSVRVPMDPRTAKAIADHFGCVLPTKKMVDEIYVNAETKVDMKTYNSVAARLGLPQVKANQPPNGRYMQSNDYFRAHNDLINEDLQQAGHRLGEIVAGIKKDVVIMKRLKQKDGVAIYGGLANNGTKTIQNLEIPHENSYSDYSHGIRLVSGEMEVDGKMVKVADVLKDPVLSKMISDEGPIEDYDSFYKTEGRFTQYPPHPNFFGIPGRAPEASRPAIGKNTALSAEKTPETKQPVVDDKANSSATQTNQKQEDPIYKDEPSTKDKIEKEEENETGDETMYKDEDADDSDEEENDEMEENGTAKVASTPNGAPVFTENKSPDTSTSYKAMAAHTAASETHEQTSDTPSPPKQEKTEVPAAPSVPPAAEKPQEQIEASSDGTIRIIGDSLSQGAVGAAARLGINALPQYLGNKTTLGGQTTIHGERTIDQMPKAPKKGALVAVFLGTNDLFGDFSPTDITKTLQRIYAKAIEKGYTIIGGTIPPPCESVYTKYYGKYTDDQLEERWKTINDWILSEGPKLGLRKIIPWHTLLADPSNPRRLNAAIRAKDGLHLKDYTPMAEALGRTLKEFSAAETSTTEPQDPTQQKTLSETQTNEKESPKESNLESQTLAGFENKEGYPEQTLTYYFPPNDPKPLRIHINAPKNFDSKNALITFYTLPEGNTIEQTIGSRGGHWRNRIQHVGAQVRELRESIPGKSRVVVYVEGPKLSLINYLRENRNLKGQRLQELIEDVKSKLGVTTSDIDIAGHSGGGSLKFAYLEHVDQIPDNIKRISFMDSNYGCTKEHIDKMTEWLKRSNEHFLTVNVYNDTQVQVKDPKTGEMKPLGASSYLKAEEMMEFLRQNGIECTQVPARETPGYSKFTALEGRVNFVILNNSQNRIRHSETVELGGLAYAETAGTKDEKPFNQANYQDFIEA